MPKNSGGELVSFYAKLSDATGITLAPAAAGTAEVIKGSALAQEDNTSGGGLTYSTSTGKLSVATAAGIGKYLVTFGIGDSVGQNAKFHTIQLFASENGAAVAAVGPKARKIEPATAVRGNVGVVQAIVDFHAVGDTVEPRLDVETSANSIVIREAFLSAVKIGEV